MRLAGNESYENQAFVVGETAYGLQFHVEVTGALVAHWAHHLPPDVFVRASDVAHVSRAGEGIVRRFVALAAAAANGGDAARGNNGSVASAADDLTGGVQHRSM